MLEPQCLLATNADKVPDVSVCAYRALPVLTLPARVIDAVIMLWPSGKSRQGLLSVECCKQCMDSSQTDIRALC
jgi:hypothetical protein